MPMTAVEAKLAAERGQYPPASVRAYRGLAEYQLFRGPGLSSAARSGGSQPPAMPAPR